MRVLIVGGTGLISTAITRQLVERGDEVILYNRGQRQAPIPRVPRIVGDRTAYERFEAQMAEVGPLDAVIDMVAFVPDDAKSAIRAFRGRTEQYIFCSTVDVYTKPAARYPIREDARREPSPSFLYAHKKAQCEQILLDAHARGEFNVTLIRPAYTYGEGRGILHTFGWGAYFLHRVRQGKPLIVHGDGTSFWSACHRDDVGRAFVGAAGNPKAYGRGYHVTGEEWLTWDAYHQGVAEAMGAPVPTLVHIPTDLLGQALPKAADWCVGNFHYSNIFDNSAAREDLGFQYTVGWVEGVRRAVEWLEDHGGFDDVEAPPFYDRLLDAWERLGQALAYGLAGLDGA